MNYIKNILIVIFLFTFLYPQWAMWANPSLPVGGSDTGIGLGAGEVMVFGDFAYQYFDWWHDKIPDAYDINGDLEDFEHNGQFNNRSLNLGFTIGLNDYWNISFQQHLPLIHQPYISYSHQYWNFPLAR